MLVKQPSHIDCLAVDADIVCFRVASVHEMSDTKTLELALDDYINVIARDTQVFKMVLFLSGSKNFRYKIPKISKSYKWNRYYKDGTPKVPKPRKLAESKQYIIDKYKGYVIDDMEADDCIASFMTRHYNVAHAGIDKDIRWGTSGYHYHFVNKEWEYTSKDEAILNQWRQVCTGDSGDGIQGLRGVGPKTAAQYVTDVETAKLQALDLYIERLTLAGRKYEAIIEYFEEQRKLITMVSDLEIPYSAHVVIDPPDICDDIYEEGDFDGFFGTTNVEPILDLE